MLRVIGAPFDLCGLRLGSRLGPAAIRLAGLEPALQAIGVAMEDGGDVPVDLRPDGGDGLTNFRPLLHCVRGLREAVAGGLADGRVPVVLGGDHTLASAGVGAACERFGDDLAVLWVDAHADVNTPGSSLTGNVHGMPLAALQGLPSETSGIEDGQWREFRELLGPVPLAPERTAWFGLRDVDAAERPRLKGLALTMHDVDRRGVDLCVARFHEWLRETGATRLWVSFDVDVLDPVLAPGTGTAVRGGLTYREAHLLAELLYEGLQTGGHTLAGVDLVETNPLVDSHNETAEMAVEWLASLCGKRIL